MKRVYILGILIYIPILLFAQASEVGGSIEGIITTEEGDILPGVSVTVYSKELGIERQTFSDESGRFIVSNLPSGTYDITVELQGFAKLERKGVTVKVGKKVYLPFKLQLETVAGDLVVTADAPVLEATRTSVSASVEEVHLRELPLDGRDFKDLLALLPGNVEVPNERVSVLGQRGIMNSFNIDGADSNSAFFGEERGGTRPPFTYSQAAVKEFQVVQSAYNVRFGGASGGIINAITKSGTNVLKGSAFFFFQDDSLVSRDAFGNRRNDFQRSQAGASLGGPLREDKLFFFVAADGQRYTEDFPRSPDHGGFLDDPANKAAFDEKLRSLGIDPETEFNYSYENNNEVFLIRFDWNVNPSHRFWFRHNYSNQYGANLTDTRFSTTGRSSNGFERNRFNSFVARLDSVVTPNLLNEFMFQFAREERPREANFTGTPEINIGFYDAVMGQNNFLPNFLDEDRYQIQNHLSYFTDGYLFKVGFDYSRLKFDDGFCRFCGGQYLFFSFQDFLDDRPFRYTQAFSPIDGIISYDMDLFAFYVGNEWHPTPKLTLELGVRYEYQNHPTPEITNPLEPLTAQIPDDKDNWAPRLGFAYDLRGDGRSVIRGGFGVFYSWTPSLLVANALLANGAAVTRVVLDAGDPGFPEFPNRIDSLGDLPQVTPDIFIFDPNFENPETYRSSLGFEQLLGDHMSVGIDIVYSRSKNFERKKDANLNPTPVGFTSDGRPIYDRYDRLDPNFGKKMMFVSDAEAEYWGITLSARRRFADNWSFYGAYTYAQSKDHDTNERSVSSSRAGWPEDHFNLDQDWSWSDYDVRHRVVLSGIYITPFGLKISVSSRYRSAFPINPFANFDINNDGFFRDRPGPDDNLGLDYHLPRNSFRGKPFFTLDLRLSYKFSIGRHEFEVMGEVFNLTNNANYRAFDNDYSFYDRRNGVLVYNPSFGSPISPGKPRTFQFGIRYWF